MPSLGASGRPRRARIVWFADLEALDADLDVLEVLRDEAGLTTVAPESHVSHTSGFRAPEDVIAQSPFEDWASRPGLADHRRVFGAPEASMAVVPGIVGGVDDGPLRRVAEACRRLGLELWGHAGMWSYGAEVFPERATLDLFGRGPLPDSLPRGTMFCPSDAELNGWMGAAFADATRRYDLDGWFLDHARHPTPAFPRGLLACACDRCETAAVEHGVDLDDCRRDVRALGERLRTIGPAGIRALGEGGVATLAALLADLDGVTRWLDVRAGILADAFADVAGAIEAAASRPVEIGADVFAPDLALLGGHDYARWTRSATYLTGGFTPAIGWGSAGRITATALGDALAGLVPGLAPADARAAVAGLLGAPAVDDEASDADAALAAIARMGAVRPDVPVYPPLPAAVDDEALAVRCAAIVEAGLDGAMVAGLEQASPGRRRILRTELAERLA